MLSLAIPFTSSISLSLYPESSQPAEILFWSSVTLDRNFVYDGVFDSAFNPDNDHGTRKTQSHAAHKKPGNE
jgi:hypothetical protein